MAGWLEINSAELHSDCGDDGTAETWEAFADGTDQVAHSVDEVHWVIFDLGASYTVSKVMFHAPFNSGAPDDLDVFVSTDGSTWGTAVLANYDVNAGYTFPSPDIQDVTPKVGRYVKLVINSTTHASDYLDWGWTAFECFDVYEGLIGDNITTYIPLSGQTTATTSTTYTPTDGSLCQIEIPWDDYTNIKSAKLVVCSLANGTTGCGEEAASMSAQLYDRTNSAQIATATATGGGINRGSDFLGSIPSGTSLCDLRIKRGCQTGGGSVFHVYIEIIQETEGTTDYVIFQDVGAVSDVTNTTYSTMGHGNSLLLGGSNRTESHFLYTTDDWDGVGDVYYGANFRSNNAAYTASIKLDDTGQSSALASFTTTATVPTHQISSSISLTNLKDYTTFGKISTRRQHCYSINEYIRIHLTDPTKFMTACPVDTEGIPYTTATWTLHNNQDRCIFNSGTTYYEGDSLTIVNKHQAVLMHSGDVSANASLGDDNTQDIEANVTTTQTSMTRSWSGAITGIADQSIIEPFYKLGTAGSFKYGNTGSSYLMYFLTGIENTTPIEGGDSTNLEINIGDAWKTVDSMQINIGDTWKDVVSVQQNIGDVWKDVF